MASVLFSGKITIVLPDSPEMMEKTAADELASYLYKITGVEPCRIKEREYCGGDAFLVAVKQLPFAAKEQYEHTVLGEEGVFYSIEKHCVFIGGGSVRGVLYSVYTFLEEELGCHRFTEDLEVIPHTDTLSLNEKTVSYVPQMHYRAASFQDGEAPEYAVFNKLNARSRIPEAFGGAIDFGVGFVHTLPLLVPDELYETHPEYFPLINGKRCHGRGYQRCLTNPDVLKMTIDAVLADFRSNPHHKTASVSQDDTGKDGNVCTCPACKRINDEEGSQMGTQLRFVNAVADAVRDEFPDHYIETLAYFFSRQICQKTKPRDNVIIRLCSIECCFSHPLATCESELNRAFVRDMHDWASVAAHIYIWDYVTCFSNFLAPHPNLPVLGENMKFFAENHTVGMFPQGAADGRGAELSELKSWLLAKLMWNPYFDVQKGTETFVRAYAGDGAEPILRYIDRVNHLADDKTMHRTAFAMPNPTFYPRSFVEAAEDDFAAAKARVSDEATLRRIRRWEMSVRYLRIGIYFDKFTPEELEREILSFTADMDNLGISKIYEWAPAGVTEQTMRDIVTKRAFLNE